MKTPDPLTIPQGSLITPVEPILLDGRKTHLKAVVYFADGSIEATCWHDIHVANGVARYATADEVASYERSFARDDARIAANEMT